ncbi:ABC transporter substrate-binding protein [Compostimonas suwonensis]|uniref:Multiple sugar transport system substrate-binding protein n=1 Tax=Compostimonas suwonensis TaxID=1048394 RepID=A0A2M9BWG5_9MICO|nr:sugar ABC transporter substrate-binding protein [Compostimonas suwonensis]PJJ62296.1 multiple sugar transport system substrate-binding protein [Compostimonas suwonensis]
MKFKTSLRAAAVVALVAPLAACSATGGGDAAGPVPIQWWTWDANQAVSYEKCATAFNEANPDIEVTVSNYGWDDYWTKLTAGFVAGDAPDTFMDHVNNYPEYADQGQLLPLDDYVAKTDFDLGKYSTGVDTWKYTDGKLYGLPKDWATIAFFYNKDMVAAAGLTDADLANMTWNPDDGGTFGEIVAKLSVDANGVHGDQPGFDKDNVVTYGIGPMGTSGNNGQDTWSGFLSTTGWTLGDEPNWPTQFEYSQPVFKKSLDWIRDLSAQGFSPKQGAFTNAVEDQLGSGKVAIVSTPSSNVVALSTLQGVPVGIAPSVVGPDGTRSSLSNANGDSIWAGTKHPDEAWKWLSYLGSTDCQSLAGADGTFFPSIPESMAVTQASMKEKGIDLSVFTELSDNKELFVTPAFQNGAELDATFKPLWESFFNFTVGDEVFDQMTEQSKEILSRNG